MLECQLEPVLHQRLLLFDVAAAEHARRFGAKRVHERLDVPMRLGDVECELGTSEGPVEIAAEPVGTRKHRCDVREVFARPLVGQHVEGLFESREGLISVPGEELELAEDERRTRTAVGVAGGAVER